MKNQKTLNYFQLIRKALSDVIRQTLLLYVPKDGQLSCHITLLVETKHPGVLLSDDLIMRHPQAITLVLQHDFRQIKVGEAAFSVFLRFDGESQKITVPFDAVLQWIDHDAEISFSLPPVSMAEKSVDKQLENRDIKGKVVHLKDFQK